MVFDLRGIEESSGSIRALKEVQGNGIPKAQEIDNVDEDDEEEEREREREIYSFYSSMQIAGVEKYKKNPEVTAIVNSGADASPFPGCSVKEFKDPTESALSAGCRKNGGQD